MDVIEIEITKGGKIKATVTGVEGPACSNISAFLDQLGKVEIDQNTDDYYKEVKQKISTKKITKKPGLSLFERKTQAFLFNYLYMFFVYRVIMVIIKK